MPERALVTGRWSDLLLLTYEVPEEVVRPHLPPGAHADLWDGRAYVNLVALYFGDVRVRGHRLPWLGGFAQLNLRTYARLDGEPGVVFLRQLVPGLLVAAVARLRYSQPCATLPITHVATARDSVVTAEYLFDQPPRGCLIATGSERATIPPPGGFEHWCKERFWGFGPARRRGRSGVVRFRVDHPAWAVRQVHDWRMELDFRTFFGPEWRLLNDRKPASVVFAVGSEVSVYEPLAVGR